MDEERPLFGRSGRPAARRHNPAGKRSRGRELAGAVSACRSVTSAGRDAVSQRGHRPSSRSIQARSNPARNQAVSPARPPRPRLRTRIRRGSPSGSAIASPSSTRSTPPADTTAKPSGRPGRDATQPTASTRPGGRSSPKLPSHLTAARSAGGLRALHRAARQIPAAGEHARDGPRISAINGAGPRARRHGGPSRFHGGPSRLERPAR